MPDCVYATEGWGIHDDRWMAALREVGFDPTAVALGRDVPNDEALRARVLALAGTDLPVLAGPLHSVTHALARTQVRLVGLSWGYDLEDMSHAGADLSWLAHLKGLIVDSHANRQVAEAAGLVKERITFLPWGVDLSVFTPDGPQLTGAELGFAEGTRVVLTLRAHEPKYRVGDVLEAFARTRAPDLVLAVGHGGALTDALRSQAQELGIADRTRFIGTVPEGDLPKLLRSASVYVTASEVDGTSVTLLQAMACGVPIVASDSQGNRGWIDVTTGVRVPLGHVDALAKAIDETASSSATIEPARNLVTREADWHANLSRLRGALDTAR